VDDAAASRAGARDITALARSADAVGVAIYGHLPQAGAMVFSPASITVALQMALYGARGETAAELARFLRLSGPDAAAEAAGRLADWPDDAADGPDVMFRMPNTMWVQSGLCLRAEFAGGLRDIAALTVKEADFAGAAAQVAQEINQVIAEQTAGKISNLVTPGLLTAATRLVLANAIYLKASWAHPFPPAATRDAPFHLDGHAEGQAGARTATVRMMRVSARFGYLRANGYQVVTLPYNGTRLAMAVILPDGPLGPLEDRFASGGVGGLAEGARPTEVALAMPKFRMSAGFRLGAVLRQVGVAAAFGADADFGGITSARRLRIDEVVHQAYIDVDEKGTEAAAATAVVMRVAARVAARPPVTVTVDRPFLFAIADTLTGVPLFLGRVTNPSAR